MDGENENQPASTVADPGAPPPAAPPAPPPADPPPPPNPPALAEIYEKEQGAPAGWEEAIEYALSIGAAATKEEAARIVATEGIKNILAAKKKPPTQENSGAAIDDSKTSQEGTAMTTETKEPKIIGKDVHGK